MQLDPVCEKLGFGTGGGGSGGGQGEFGCCYSDSLLASVSSNDVVLS